MKKTIEQNQLIEKQISPIAEQAIQLEITSDQTLKEAVSLLSQLNIFSDRIEEEKQKVLKPLLEATKAERARWKPSETLYTAAIEDLRSKMSIYQTEQVNARLRAEQAIVERIKAGKGNLSLEKAVEKIEALPEVAKNVPTDIGDVQFREKKVLKITDESQVPGSYWIIDENKLLEDLKAGFTITGCELETIFIPINYR